MCTEPTLLFGQNPIWKAIANSGVSEPWCLVYQVWWLNVLAAVLVVLVAASGVSRAFPLLYQRFIQDVQAKPSSDTEFKIRKVWVAMIALLLIFIVSIVGIAISNRPSLLIWSLGVDESQRVYHFSKDANDYLLGALRQVAYAMFSAWLAALLIGVLTLPPLFSNALSTLADFFGALWQDFFDKKERTNGKATDIPYTFWQAYQSRRNFETPTINLHADTPDKDDEFVGKGASMTPIKLRAEKFWLSRDGLHLWLREPPQNIDNETKERTEFKLIWVSASKCYKAQAIQIDETTFELNSNVNYCDLPSPKFALELDKVAYHIEVDI